MAHWPGCGVGGNCIAVNPYYLIKRASLSGFNHKFLKVAREINNYMPEYVIYRLVNTLNEIGLPLKHARVSLLGLSYKPNIASLRKSPAIEIGQRLINKGVKLTIYDPLITKNPRGLKKAKLVTDMKTALKGTHAVVLATAHSEFKVNFIEALLETKIKVIIDGRNCLDKNKIESLGIIYKGIGR